MKSFTTAVEEIVNDENEGKVQVLDRDGNPQFNEDGTPEMDDPHVLFEVDDRIMRGYNPTEGQLALMVASLGRGQSQDSRLAIIINIMMECLRDQDRDYMEGRLLTRDKKRLMPMKQITEIFEYLVSEWFARPTQRSSGSATSSSVVTTNSIPLTTPSPEASSDSPPIDS